jgi:DNA-binding CsgD family transcriptional regulator
MKLLELREGDLNYVGVATTILSWPDKLTANLQQTFGLTTAEASVLKDITLGRSLKDIASLSTRSLGTIRTHVNALLEKTETRSQIELIRVTLGFLDVVEPAAPLRSSIGFGDASSNGNSYDTLALPDGRRLCKFACNNDPLRGGFRVQ